jgi:hypothetical protein
VPGVQGVPGVPGVLSSGGDGAGGGAGAGGAGAAGARGPGTSGWRGGAGRRGRLAVAAARRGPRGARRIVRERRLRRAVRRLEPCLDVVSSFQRRVLVLRSGLGKARPHTRRGTAHRLGVSLPRVTRAERRGVRAISRADRATGCGYAVSGGGSGGGGFELIAERAPMVAAVLGVDSAGGGDKAAAVADTTAVGGETAGGSAEHPIASAPGPAADIAAAAAEGAALAVKGGAFPFMFLLALVALLLALGGATGGRRVAGAVLDRRAEEASERHHDELVGAIRDILRDREQR